MRELKAKLKAKLKSPDGEKLTAIFNTVDYIKLKDLLSHHYPKHELISWEIEKIEFINDTEEVYCKICQSCGEEGCCIPTICQNNKDGMYCEINLLAIKKSYCILNDFRDWLEENKEDNQYFINKINEIEDRIEGEFNK